MHTTLSKWLSTLDLHCYSYSRDPWVVTSLALLADTCCQSPSNLAKLQISRTTSRQPLHWLEGHLFYWLFALSPCAEPSTECETGSVAFTCPSLFGRADAARRAKFRSSGHPALVISPLFAGVSPFFDRKPRKKKEIWVCTQYCRLPIVIPTQYA